MKIFTFTLFLFILSIAPSFAIEKNAKVEEIINSIKIDSLMKYVSQITGEEDVKINNSICRIKSRSISYSHSNTYLAEEYLLMKFREFGYTPQEDVFYKSTDPKSKGRHIYAIKQGSKFPEKRWYISAHLDCVGDTDTLNYGADDDASGVGAVLEAARLFSTIQSEYSIVFMLFNTEESGWGPSHLDSCPELIPNIKGGIDVDMIAWDGNNDSLSAINYSDSLGFLIMNQAFAVNDIYKIGLKFKTKKEFSGNDYRYFTKKIPSITIREDNLEMTDDYNPYYHSNKDRLDKFNKNYYLMLSKLMIGTLATVSNEPNTNDVQEKLIANQIKINPNPANVYTQISGISSGTAIIYNILGTEVWNGFVTDNMKIDVSCFLKGVYFLRLGNEVTNFMVQR